MYLLTETLKQLRESFNSRIPVQSIQFIRNLSLHKTKDNTTKDSSNLARYENAFISAL